MWCNKYPSSNLWIISFKTWAVRYWLSQWVFPGMMSMTEIWNQGSHSQLIRKNSQGVSPTLATWSTIVLKSESDLISFFVARSGVIFFTLPVWRGALSMKNTVFLKCLCGEAFIMSTAAKLASIASSSSDQKAKTEEYKALLAQLVSGKDVDGLAVFVDHSTYRVRTINRMKRKGRRRRRIGEKRRQKSW